MGKLSGINLTKCIMVGPRLKGLRGLIGNVSKGQLWVSVGGS